MLKRICLFAILLTSLHCVASVLEVGTCIPGLTQFPTIQDAVNAATPGSTVLVCPGTYPEQVTVKKPLSIRGAKLPSASGATIVAPQGGMHSNTSSLSSGNPLATQLLVDSTNDVRISNISVDGANNGLTTCGSPVFIGIFYRNASGRISHTAVVNQALGSGDAGCQSGLAIFVQSGQGSSSKVEIASNTIHGYQKNGITANEQGSWVSVLENTVVGIGSTTGAAENGIQFGFGATGKVVRNTAIDDVFSPAVVANPGNAASGILVFASSGVLIRENFVGNNQFGIALVTDPSSGSADNNAIVENEISASHLFDGIEVCSDNNTIRGNVINRSDRAGVHLDSGCSNSDGTPTGQNNRVRLNTINSACAGILGNGAANFLFGNDFLNVANTVLDADQCVSSATAAARIAVAGERTPSPQPIRP